MNKVALLRQTLAALLAQDIGRDAAWEVVVVNDGSTDDTEQYLESLADTDDPELKIVSPATNVGRARARNLGARAARGRYLLFLDDDIVAPPGLVAAHLDMLDEYPDCGTIGYAVTAPELIDAPHFAYMDSRGVARLSSGFAPARFFVTQNATVPRPAFLSVAGFDEEFSSYGFEDMELAFRLEDLQHIRFRVVLAPVPVHVHHHSAAEYFEKKRECGRSSLPHLARLHPGRLREMRLHHVVDLPSDHEYPGQTGVATRLFRFLAAGAWGRALPRLMAGWPCTAGSQPRFRRLYFQLMNLTVLCLYRQNGR